MRGRNNAIDLQNLLDPQRADRADDAYLTKILADSADIVVTKHTLIVGNSGKHVMMRIHLRTLPQALATHELTLEMAIL